MSGNKIIVRPKVRFSQFSDSEKRCQGEDSKIACKDATTARKQAKGPKIRSIVPFKKHVRIMAPEKSTGTTDRNVRLSDREIEISTSSDTSPEDVQKTSVLKDNVSRIESSKILRNANDIKDTKEPCKTSDKGIHARSSSLKDHGTSLQQKGKENKDMAVKTVSTKNVVKTGIDTRSVSRSAPHKKLDNSRSDVNVRTLGTADPKISNATRSRSVSSRMSKASALGAKSDVMPCYRRLQIARTKSKTSQVKKLVLYDTTSGRTRTFVGPGVSRGRQNDATAVDKTGRSVSPDVAADKLARPSCNSIMCVIEKLNKLELQRIVTDVEHLPPVQKNLVNGKVRIYAHIHSPFLF